MEALGTKLPASPVDFKWVRDLYHLDGSPMVSLYRNQKTLFIFYWCDCSETKDRWIIVEVTERSYQQALAGTLNLSELLRIGFMSSFVFLLDRSNESDAEEFRIVTEDKIPDQYLPKDSVFLEVNDSEQIVASDEAIILFDLKDGIKQLHEFMHNYRQVHNLRHAMDLDLIQRVPSRPWDAGDGWSSSHFTKDLRGVIHHNQKVEEAAIEAASPGMCRLYLSTGLAEEIHGIVVRFSENEKTIVDSANQLQNYLKQYGLLKVSKATANRFAEDEDALEARDSFVYSIWTEEQYKSVERNRSALEATKILLSSYRRIKKIYRYYEEWGISSVRWEAYKRSIGRTSPSGRAIPTQRN